MYSDYLQITPSFLGIYLEVSERWDSIDRLNATLVDHSVAMGYVNETYLLVYQYIGTVIIKALMVSPTAVFRVQLVASFANF